MKKEKENLVEELKDKSELLLKNMEDRTYDMIKQYGNSFLTLVGFLIATSGIIITSDNVDENVRRLLVRSIFCFVLWLFLSNNLYWAQIFKFKKWLDSLVKIPELTEAADIFSAQTEADNHLKINRKDIIFGGLSTLLENAGFVLFVIWLFKFL